ncbi:MAG: site-specific DNA-methyltransferase [Deltaproteobacteria bacterium]|nr:site-specific DNA-methyltransferase [Deltaproteobacteria bacterium]
MTDPPYGIGIADWDADVPSVETWAAVLGALKPGAWLVAFGARRTVHRLATRVEAAGFCVVDMGAWVYGNGRPPSKVHLKPAHEPILIARAPGKPLAVGIEDARVPWRDDDDRVSASRVDSLRARTVKRRAYRGSLGAHGRDAFVAKVAGRWPSTVMATDDELLGDGSHVFAVPKVRDAGGHVCAKPRALIEHLVKLYVPVGGVVLDPFAGSGGVGDVAAALGRRAVLIDDGAR